MATYTTAGEEFVVDVIDGTTAVPTWHVDWGTGTTADVKGDTTLETPAPEARVATTQSQPSASINQFQGTITASATRAITEAGLFTALTSGTLIIRDVFTVVNLASGESIQFTITLEQT